MQVFVVGSFVVACSVKVARLPRAGESLDASAFVSEAGGKGFNLALAMHRLGATVAGAFAVGDDPFAAVAGSAFARAGLSTDMLVTKSGSTGAGIGFVDDRGENCLAVSLGANRLLSGEDVLRRAPGLDAAQLVLATFESPNAPIAAAFARARSRGARTLLNPSPSRPIAPEILANTAILVVNRVEAEDLGLRPEAGTVAGAEALLAAGPEIVVVTLGADGAMAVSREGPPIRQPAFPVSVVDTIGAGDAFSAGFAAALLQGRPLDEALRRAAAYGGLAACRFGAFDAFPDALELERFLESAGA